MESPEAETLRTLHAAATEIQSCDTAEAACERTVEAAERVLEFDLCSVLLHEDERLVPVALSSAAPPDGARPMGTDQGLAGKTFQNGESYVVDSVSEGDDTEPAKDSYRSGMSVPIGEVGVFQAVSEEPDAFSDRDVEFTELLVAHTARTVDRIQFQRELEARREALERQNDRLEKFVRVVSHDIRNPLNVATGQLELVRQEVDDERLDAVARSHDRMGTLIDELLALARKGQRVEETERVSLGVVAEDCWRNVATGGATVEIRDDPTLRADVSRLKRLVENLFRNCVEHGTAGGPEAGPDPGAADAPEVGAVRTAGSDEAEDLTVRVGSFEDGFYVADDGRGIPEEKRETVFDAGYTTASDGTGLGLNIVAEIADAHGWDVAVTASEADGARFELSGVKLDS